MTVSKDGPVCPRRVNREGDPCPPWCRTDHAEMLIPGKPRFGYMSGHYSDPIHQAPGAPGAVMLALEPSAGAETAVSLALAPGGVVRLMLSPEQARELARVIEHDSGDRRGMLAAELRAAASIARQVGP